MKIPSFHRPVTFNTLAWRMRLFVTMVSVALAASGCGGDDEAREVTAWEYDQVADCWLPERVVGTTKTSSCGKAFTSAMQSGKCFLFRDTCVADGFQPGGQGCAATRPFTNSCSK